MAMPSSELLCFRETKNNSHYQKKSFVNKKKASWELVAGTMAMTLIFGYGGILSSFSYSS